jgi:hypothetical protein
MRDAKPIGTIAIATIAIPMPSFDPGNVGPDFML